MKEMPIGRNSNYWLELREEMWTFREARQVSDIPNFYQCECFFEEAL